MTARLRALLSIHALRMVVVLGALWLWLAVYPDTRDAFLTAGNFSNLTAQVAEIVVIGVGMTLVIILGGIDLSVGAGMALTGVVAAKLQIDHAASAWAAVPAALAVGTAVGLWHGLLVGRFKVPPFIATLSGFLGYRGAALVLSDARGLSPMRPDFALLGGRLGVLPTRIAIVAAVAIGVFTMLRTVAKRRKHALPADSNAWLATQIAVVLAVAALFAVVYGRGVPVPVLLAAGAVAVGALVLRRARLGRWALAVGGNAEAARLAGVPVENVHLYIYAFTGFLTGVAGVIAAARTNGVTPGNAGLMRELHVITAVVIGGTSLSGGSGTMIGTVVGALIFGTLSNGMNLMNVNSNWQLVLSGAVLLGASLLDSLSSKRRHR